MIGFDDRWKMCSQPSHPPLDSQHHWLRFPPEEPRDPVDPFGVLGGFLVGPENRLAETAASWILGGVPFFADSPHTLDLSRQVRASRRQSAKKHASSDTNSPFSRLSYPLFPAQSAEEFPPIIDYMPIANVPNLSPILFFGPSGSGKSALARGICREYRRLNPNRKAILIPGTDFLGTLLDSVSNRTGTEFQSFFHDCGLLVLDAIEPVIASPVGLENLLPLLDRAARGGTVVILTLVDIPREQTVLVEALRARIFGGLLVPFALPERDSRAILVERFASALKIALEPETFELLVDRLGPTVGAMYGALRQMTELFNWAETPPAPAKVRLFLDERQPAPAVDIETIARVTAKRFTVKLSEMRSKSRRKTAVAARNMTICLARELLGSTYTELGMWFAGRDHTTVMHGESQIKRQLASDPALAAAREAILEEIRAPAS
ncbi:MAG: hypothetical protein J6S27_00840 [Thermoguttaceae bacterium]|nr:hypothetical protein [Thermoguttaceae bacterium]